jgi:hypothetical protein
MKKENYLYLAAAIISMVLWLTAIQLIIGLKEIAIIVGGCYCAFGWILVAMFVCLSIPTKEDEYTVKKCSICGEKIKKNEQSLHFVRSDANGESYDYCEKCKGKIKE